MTNIKITNTGGVRLLTENKYCPEDINVSVDTTNLSPENLRSGVNVLGVTGTYAGGSVQAKFVEEIVLGENRFNEQDSFYTTSTLKANQFYYIEYYNDMWGQSGHFITCCVGSEDYRGFDNNLITIVDDEGELNAVMMHYYYNSRYNPEDNNLIEVWGVSGQYSQFEATSGCDYIRIYELPFTLDGEE